jgi:hypothetical protein
VGVLGRGNNADWLVQQVVNEFRQDPNRGSVYFNDVVVDEYSPPKNCELTIDTNATLGNEFLTLTTAPPTSLREHLLQPLTLHMRPGDMSFSASRRRVGHL